MMLDNKNEQKWPLTEKEVRKEQTVKGHFFLILPPWRAIFCCVHRKEKGSSPKLPQHIYHSTAEKISQHLIDRK